jgi:hypothetical protein
MLATSRDYSISAGAAQFALRQSLLCRICKIYLPRREDAYIIDLQSCQYGYNAKGTVLNVHDRVIGSRGPEKARRA